MKTIAVTLSAGAPHSGEAPTIQQSITATETVLNWQLKAISPDFTYIVGGYESDLIQSVGENQVLVKNEQWSESGSAYSLLITPFLHEKDTVDESELIVFYGDVLFRKSFIERLNLLNSDVTVAWDSQNKFRYTEGLPDLEERVFVRDGIVERVGVTPQCLSNGRFVGVVKFAGRALSFLRDISQNNIEKFKKATLADLIEFFRLEGFDITAEDIDGDWAEVGADSGVARFVLGTKAESLDRLRGLITKSKIEDQVYFTVAEWHASKEQILSAVRTKFGSVLLIVRSSARSEDSFNYSNAGAYTSLLNVEPNEGLAGAIEEVIFSYDNLQIDDQVLIQPMLKNVVASGVAFTRTLEFGAPYYVINYDETGSTDGITAGNNNDHKTLIIRRDSKPEQVANQKLLSLKFAIEEIEELLHFDALDIEFAITKLPESDAEIVHILQVRPIAVANESGSKDGVFWDSQSDFIEQAEALWKNLKCPAAHIVGDSPIYGVMPDWNPAEIIGTNPGKLAESLYKYLIMDETWATQRAEYGYRDVRPQPLLVSFAGKPYVDVRASFNSFLPANLDDNESEALVSFYLGYLRENPKLHDKVEFEVLPTCVGPSFYLWEQRLIELGGLSKELITKLKEGLLTVSRYAIEHTQDYLQKIESLEERINERRKEQIKGHLDFIPSIRNVRLLLDECRLYGTLPFAHLARSGFIAATFLKEGVKEGWLSQNAMDSFMASVRTVSHDLASDAKATAIGEMSWDDFVSVYGHLRPGTYDITSPAYFDDPERFLRPIVEAAYGTDSESSIGHEDAWLKEREPFFNNVRQMGFDYSDKVLERFLRDAIEGREKAKFIFSRDLSEALEMLRTLSGEFNLSVDECANLSIYDVLDLSESMLNKNEQIDRLKEKAVKNERQRKLSAACELPAILTDLKDFYSFELTAGVPNFIGSTRVMAPCVHLQNTEQNGVDVKGAVVLIPQADPGYDWLFGQGIAGLITMYGGANSHMAIRSAEFGLPAAIGIGEQLFKQFSQTREIELDPSNNLMRAIR